MNIVKFPSTSPRLEDLIKRAKEFAAAAKAPATLKAYRNDWRDFDSWCFSQNLSALPATAETVALYITDRASSLAVSTITRRLTAISKAHQAAGFKDSPASCHYFIVSETLKGIRRKLGTAQIGKAPLLSDDIRKILKSTTNDLRGLRDRALILVGFAGAFRRSELVSIRVSDLSFSKEGVVIDLRVSKTDQEGAGRKVGIPFGEFRDTCPVRALKTWLAAAEISHGPIFRRINRYGFVGRYGLSADSVGKLVKQAAARAGIASDSLGAHSLRVGFVTQAAMNGVDERIIMQQTGHRDVATLRRYIRTGQIFRQNAASKLGI
jgi:site-specific recombinase XerD